MNFFFDFILHQFLFFILDLVIILLIAIYFILDGFWKWIFFLQFYPPLYLHIIFYLHSFYCYFFNFDKFFKLIFFILYFNIRLSFLTDLNLGFNRLQILRINLSLGDSPSSSIVVILYFLNSCFLILLFEIWFNRILVSIYIYIYYFSLILKRSWIFLYLILSLSLSLYIYIYYFSLILKRSWIFLYLILCWI
jgi:hypothetical protein